MYCVIPGIPQLEWKPCLGRDEARSGPHVYFLESTDHLSLFCPSCRVRRPRVFVGAKAIVAYVNALLAAGKVAEANDIVDGRRSPKVDNIDDLDIDSPQTGRQGHSPGSSTSRHEATAGDSRTRTPAAGVTAGETAPTYTAHCCPRIVLGHGLHSPTCAKYAGESMPAIPRDDPKAEAGSFERVLPWRPKYRDRADWDEWRHERAAIFEYEGGYQRKHAEIAANRLAGPPP